MTKRIKVGLALGLVILLLAFSIGDRQEPAMTEAPLVKTQVAGAGTLATDSDYAGVVRGRYETKMSFQADGRIVACNVQVGTPVRTGDVLMLIDAQAEGKPAVDDTHVEDAKAKLNLAQSNLKRYNELYKNGEVSEATLEQYQTNYDAAFAAYQNALAQAAQTHNDLGYTKLVAGANGVVSSLQAKDGENVTAGQTVLTLVQTNELEVEINVPANRVDEVTVGMPATLAFADIGAQAEGKVREISATADAATNDYRVRVSVAEPPEELQLGMAAEVSFTPNTAAIGQAAVLPLSAITKQNGKTQVWVVGSDNKVQKKEVTAKLFGDNQVLVQGLRAEDVVVTAGLNQLREGELVRTEAEEP